MPFRKLTRDEEKKWPKPCMSREHNPPSHMVLPAGTHVWVCPACGKEQVIHVAGYYLRSLNPSLGLSDADEMKARRHTVYQERWLAECGS